MRKILDAPHSPASAAPPRSAVRHLTAGSEEAGQRLDRVLGRVLAGVPRSRIFRLIRRGAPEQRLKEGDVMRLPPVYTAPADAPPRVPAILMRQLEQAIIYEEPRLLALDKPAGIAVHGGSGLSFGVIEALRASRPQETLELAHRLDRDTSGCLMIARRGSALRALHALLREGAVEKKYLLLVAGHWRERRTVDAPLRTDLRVGGERTVKVDARGKPALTGFRLLEQYGAQAALLEATLHTGRTHQIRVHAAHSGHPVAGDDKYGDAAFNEQLRALGLTRMFLHAHSCAFTWPTGEAVSLSAPLPEPLRVLLERLPTARRSRTA
jgi:23S rRNA pseudouridine955/2504/2580 synthase